MSWSAERSRAETNIVVKSVLEMEQTKTFEPKRITLKFFGHHEPSTTENVICELGVRVGNPSLYPFLWKKYPFCHLYCFLLWFCHCLLLFVTIDCLFSHHYMKSARTIYYSYPWGLGTQQMLNEEIRCFNYPSSEQDT